MRIIFKSGKQHIFIDPKTITKKSTKIILDINQPKNAYPQFEMILEFEEHEKYNMDKIYTELSEVVPIKMED